MPTILLIGIAQALFLVSLLLQKIGESKSYRLLILWLLLMTLNQCFFLNSVIPFDLPIVLIILGASVPLLSAPVYYFYVRQLTGMGEETLFIKAIHYSPVVLFNIFFLHLHFQNPDSIEFRHGFIYSNIYADLHYYGYLFACSPLVYFTLSYCHILKFRKRLKENYSAIEKINLSWLLVWIKSSLLFFIFSFLAIWLATQHQILPQRLSFQLVGTFNTVYIFYLGFFGLKKTPFYSGLYDGKMYTQENKTKYEKTGLTREQGDSYKEKLLHHLDKNKPYLNPELTLNQLAEELGISVNHLSQVINQLMETSFFKLINQYRVEEVKRKMADKYYDHYTLLGIALESGFNSKSTFIKAFKEFTGLTPAAYKDQARKTGK